MDLSMFEVIDLTEPDNIADTIAPRLGEEYGVKMSPETPLYKVEMFQSKTELLAEFKQEVLMKAEVTLDSKWGLMRIKQDPSGACKREIKEDPESGVGRPRGKSASSSATIKSEDTKQELGQPLVFKFEASHISHRIKAEQIGIMGETKVESGADIDNSVGASGQVDIEIIDLT